MNLLDALHEKTVHSRRVRVLAEAIARQIPQRASVLDVGCGDGQISSLIQELRPDISLEGVDVMVRPQTRIVVKPFDGNTLPYTDRSFDAVMFVDVLHHTTDPRVLLSEGARVATSCVIIKDHLLKGMGAGVTLRAMDWIGNAKHGVALTYNYWPEWRWREALRELDLSATRWTTQLGLYPLWANWLFGRSLHFLASLEKNGGPQPRRPG